jgi:DNA-binding MurR/RpiR family transcriptional regulator
LAGSITGSATENLDTLGAVLAQMDREAINAYAELWFKACTWAREQGLPVVAITGFSGGKIGDLADIHIHFPSDNYGIVEDMQQSVGHNVTQRLQSHPLGAAANS